MHSGLKQRRNGDAFKEWINCIMRPRIGHISDVGRIMKETKNGAQSFFFLIDSALQSTSNNVLPHGLGVSLVHSISSSGHSTTALEDLDHISSAGGGELQCHQFARKEPPPSHSSMRRFRNSGPNRRTRVHPDLSTMECTGVQRDGPCRYRSTTVRGAGVSRGHFLGWTGGKK